MSVADDPDGLCGQYRGGDAALSAALVAVIHTAVHRGAFEPGPGPDGNLQLVSQGRLPGVSGCRAGRPRAHRERAEPVHRRARRMALHLSMGWNTAAASL